MQVSAAKLEANRRNAKLSSGPKTAAGKERSSRNAVTHGLRAEKLIVLEEDPQVLDERREAWRACLLPGDDVEERLVDSAVVHTWMQDRARRAQASRINANITNYGVDHDQTTEEEVVALGRRLFKDRLGPLVTYPTGCMNIGTHQCRSATTSYAGQRDDPDVPIDLVLRLQSTLLGCEWLLAEWARLKTILDQGQPWVQSDKLKAVRLLGKQPFDAIDDKDVAMMFLASFVLKGHRARWDWEIIMEMNTEEIDTFRKNAATRQLDSLTPSDATKAREALVEIIERATQRLTIRAEAHRERARVMAALATDFLAFDDSPGGERLRRFELASGRGLSRSLDDLRKHRHSLVRGPLSVVSSPLSVVSGPLSVVACEAEALTEPISPNEPTVAAENATNEPTVGALSVVSSPLPVVSCALEAVDEPNAPNEATVLTENAPNEPTQAHENATNEATAVQENVTNEPTIGPLSVVSSPLPVVSCAVEAVDEPNAPNEATVLTENAPNEPTEAHENVTNEPTATHENVTNEPTGGPLSVVSSPLTVVSCAVEAVDEWNAPNEPTVAHENAPNEPIDAYENAPNEPKLATGGENGESAELSAHTNHHEESLESQIDLEKAWAWVSQGVEGRKAARAESLRRLNEESQHEALAAQAIRHSLRGGHTSKNGKPGDHTNGQKEATDNAVEDQHGNEATDNEQRTVHKVSGIGHVDEITDNGQRITDKTEIVGGELSEEQFRATRFALWQEQDARSRITPLT